MIRINNLNFSFKKGERVLKDLNFEVDENTSTAILGPNGSGKTSLLFVIAGIYKFAGSININGLSVENNPEEKIRDHLGVVFQNPGEQLFMPTVREELELTLLQKYNRVDGEKVESYLEKFSLDELSQSPPHRLSEGEKKKVALASALIGEPEILLMDEPTSHLDIPGRKKILKLINSVQRTKLIATHDLSFAEKCCDRALILRNGKILERGKFKRLTSDRKLLKRAGLV